MTKKFSKNYISSIQRILMLLFFTAAYVNGATAQNSCTVTGPDFSQEVIATCAVPSTGPLLTYQVFPLLASTFSWSIYPGLPFPNTSGAFIVGSTTGQTVTVNPGAIAGSFFLIANVTQIAIPHAVSSCAVTVVVFKPEILPVTNARCGPGTITIGSTGCTLSSGTVTSTVRWYDAAVGGNLVHTGTTFTPNISATTPYWAECGILVTPQLPYLPFNCVSPRTEVVATVYPLPPCTITGPDGPLTPTLAGNLYSGPGGMSAYDWSIAGNGSIVGSTTGQTVSVTTGANCNQSFTLTLTITDQNGCQSTCTKTVSVNSVSLSLTAPSVQPACNSTGNTVSGTVSGGSGPYTCTASFDAAGTGAGWSVTNCAVVGNNLTVTYTAGSSVLTVLFVTVTDANGCQATATLTLNCQASDQGCSPHFWKTHKNLWDQFSDPIVASMPAAPLNFRSKTSFLDYFGLSAAWASANGFPANIKMLGAVSQGGSGCKAFARHAVSALLTSASGLNIPYPAGTNDFTSLYNAIRTALHAGDCAGSLFNQLAAISMLDGPWCSALKNLGNRLAAASGADTESDENQLNMFPNPAGNYVNISFVPARSVHSSILLYDRNGNLVSTVYNGMAEGGKTYQRTIDTRSLSAGVYIIKFHNGNTISIKKLIITK